MKPDVFVFLINTDDVIKLHEVSINRFGGRKGMKDFGLLESAVNHPLMLIYYGNSEDSLIHNLAASYFFHIIKNHAFEDGNKRAGLSAALYFLNRNGFCLEVDFEILYQLALDAASSKLTEKEIGMFFQKFLKKIN